MRLFTVTRLLLSTPPPLRIEAPQELPDYITLRRYRSEDRDSCLALYAESAAAGSPALLRSEFEEFLDSTDYLRLVLSDGLQVVALGGIGIAPSFRWDLAWMVYGIEAPWHSAIGLDSVMLMAKVSALPRPESPVKLVVSRMPRRESLRRHSGFQRQGRLPTLKGRVPLECDAAMLDAETWTHCSRRLADLGLRLEGPVARDINV